MRKFIAIAILFMVSLVSFNANASPPDYNDLGINPIVMQIDNVIIADAYTVTPLATLETYSYQPLFNFTDVNYGLYDDTGQAQTNPNIYINTGKHSNSQTLLPDNLQTYDTGTLTAKQNTITLLYGTPLLCYTTDITCNHNLILNKKKHSRYRQLLNYTTLGYGLWS